MRKTAVGLVLAATLLVRAGPAARAARECNERYEDCRDQNHRGNFSPGPFDRSPVDISHNTFCIGPNSCPPEPSSDKGGSRPKHVALAALPVAIRSEHGVFGRELVSSLAMSLVAVEGALTGTTQPSGNALSDLCLTPLAHQRVEGVHPLNSIAARDDYPPCVFPTGDHSRRRVVAWTRINSAARRITSSSVISTRIPGAVVEAERALPFKEARQPSDVSRANHVPFLLAHEVCISPDCSSHNDDKKGNPK